MRSPIASIARFAIASVFAAAGASHAEDVITLKFASPYPVGHPSYVMAKEYIDDIQKLTNNKVRISYFPAEQLGKSLLRRRR